MEFNSEYYIQEIGAKNPWNPSAQDLKIQWGIHFLTFLNTDRNAPKKNFEQKYGHSHFKSALKINFQLWEVVKLKMHVYANTCIFSWTTSRSRKLIFKADLKLECPYFNSKFFFRAFRSVFKKVKKWISHCIFKSCAEGFQGLYLPTKQPWGYPKF